MSRPFRPRPLDIYKKLPLVKSIRDLDIDEGPAASRSVLHCHGNGNSDVEQTSTTKRRIEEIPTPQYVVVDSYERDYLCTFAQPLSYVRSWGARSEATEFVEYDLDGEDEDWLQCLNNEQQLLSPESFEWMLYMMELLDHKARERAGGMLATFGVPTPVMLQQQVVLEALRPKFARSAVLLAAYDYWKTKRKQWQKPILRQLQPCPPVNDTNPFNVFRPREKLHRPHTRRQVQRRENDVQSFARLRQVRSNLEHARALLQVLHKREEKKRELMDCEASLQRFQILAKHKYQLDEEVIEGMSALVSTPYLHKAGSLKKDEVQGSFVRSNFSVVTPDLVNGNLRMRPSFNALHPVSDGLQLNGGDIPKRKGKRKMVHQSRIRPLRKVESMPSLEPIMLFAQVVEMEKLTEAGIVAPKDLSQGDGFQGCSPYSCQARIGRGGRVIFDRWRPLTQTPMNCNVFTNSSRFVTSLHPPPPRLSLEKANGEDQL